MIVRTLKVWPEVPFAVDGDEEEGGEEEEEEEEKYDDDTDCDIAPVVATAADGDTKATAASISHTLPR